MCRCSASSTGRSASVLRTSVVSAPSGKSPMKWSSGSNDSGIPSGRAAPGPCSQSGAQHALRNCAFHPADRARPTNNLPTVAARHYRPPGTPGCRKADTFHAHKPRPPANYRRGDKDQAPDCSAAPIPDRCPASPASAPWHQRERLRRRGHRFLAASLRGSIDRAHQSGGKRHGSKGPRDHLAGRAGKCYQGDYRKAHWHDDHQRHRRKQKAPPEAALMPEIGHSPVETRASPKLHRVWD